MREISIICWNINRVCTKLEKTNVFEILCDYDVIALSETKNLFTCPFTWVCVISREVTGIR